MSNSPPDHEPGKIVDTAENFELRGLQAINGGGAIALLGFLGQTWDKASSPTVAIIAGLVPMVLGLIAATKASIAKARHTDAIFRQDNSAVTGYRRAMERNRDMAFRLFCLAVFVVIIGIVITRL